MCVVLPFWTESSEVCVIISDISERMLPTSATRCQFPTDRVVLWRQQQVLLADWKPSNSPKPELDLVGIPDTTFTPAEDTAIVTLINFVLFSIISTTLSKTVGVGLEHCDPRLDISSLKNRIVKSDLHTTASHQQDRLEGQTSGGSHNWAQQYCTSPAG